MGTESQATKDIVEFEPNKPVEVALLYAAGKTVNTARGARVMFSLVDGRVMFLDLGPAQKINDLRVKPREPFIITMHWSGKRGDPKEFVASLSIEAELRRAQSGAAAAGDGGSVRRYGQTLDRRSQVIGAKVGEQGDGTFMVPGAGAGAPAPAEAAGAKQPSRKLAQQLDDNGNSSKGAPSMHQGWAQFLLSETNALVDVFAAAVRHGEQAGVRPDQVLALMQTAFTKGRSGGPNVA